MKKNHIRSYFNYSGKSMRDIAAVSAMSVLLIAAAGCKSTEEEDFYPAEEGALTLRVSQTNVTLSAYGTAEEISVESNSRWQLSIPEADNNSWLKWEYSSEPAGTANGSFRIYAEENMTREARHAEIMIAGPTKSETINVTQKGMEVYVTPTEMNAQATGGEVSFSIRSTSPWILQCDEKWVSIPEDSMSGEGSGEAEEVTVTLESNMLSSIERTANIFVKSPTNAFDEITVKITQLSNVEPIIYVDKTAITLSAEGENGSFSLKSFVPWTLSCADSWLTVDKKSGEGTATLERIIFTASSNMASNEVRTGHIVISSPTKQFEDITIRVEQTGNTLPMAYITPTNINAKAEGGEMTLSVRCFLPWRLVCLESWVKIDKTSGSGDGETETIKLTLDSNMASHTPRSATIFLESPEQRFTTQTVSLTQAASSIPVVENLVIGDTGKTTALITCDYYSESKVTEKGIYISTDSDFASGYVRKLADEGEEAGKIVVNAKGLSEDTQYYVKAYVNTEYTQSESAVRSFRTLGKRPDNDDNPTPQ